MIHPRRALSLLAVLVVALTTGNATNAQRGDDKKPSLSLRATPPVGFSPLRVRLVVDVKGGADDYADFYCPSIEWDWGDAPARNPVLSGDIPPRPDPLPRRWASPMPGWPASSPVSSLAAASTGSCSAATTASTS